VDFGPFMADLERRIKKNWLPPRGSESRKVMLLFYIARDGRVVRIDTKVSSGDADADRAAIEAVRAAAPFQAFPPQVKEEVLPVEFSFDYNVL
ncbi:TonB family protein, partial [Glaesserella parasuis]|uniref:TonB family protein n=1 Tax=Glaesserella parasuis TaxID=738 RepID=UPI003F3007EA